MNHQDAPRLEEFRLLALNVLSLLEDSPDRSLTVFSATAMPAHAGVAANLSLALTQHTDVLLLHQSLDEKRRGGGRRNQRSGASSNQTPGNLQKALPGLEPAADGLENGLLSSLDRPHALQVRPTRAAVAPGSGTFLAQPTTDVTRALEDARRRDLFVIIDAPPADQSADAYLFAREARNVLYVMTNEPQDLAAHQAVLDQLKRLHAHVLGVVLTDR